MDDAARKRAARRRDDPRWTIRRHTLCSEHTVCVAASIDERLAMMWPLAVEAWSVAGRGLPDYERADTPGRLVHR
jgi:hypothetical protein